MMYAVYTIVKKTNGEKQNVMITNVEARNAYAAEHKILDSFYTGIDNATAYDVENVKEMEYAARHFIGSKVLDYKEFTVKAKAREQKIQECIDESLDEIAEAEKDNEKLLDEIYELEAKIRKLRTEIKGNSPRNKSRKDWRDRI